MDSFNPPEKTPSWRARLREEGARNAVLASVGLVLVSQLPTTIAAIADPFVRSCMLALCGLLVFVVGYLTTHRRR